MQVLNFILSSLSFLLLLFALHLFFAKLGNQLLNRLLSVLLFARVGQIVVFILMSSNEQALFPVIQQIFTPFYYAAPAGFYLYITCFINGRTKFRKSDWLHAIPVVLAIIHVIPWPFSPSIHWQAVAIQILENKRLFITERTGLFPPLIYSVGGTILVLGYLIAAWHAVLTSLVIREKAWEINKVWIFFCLIVATFFKVVSILPLIFGSLNLTGALNLWFIIIKCGVLLFVIVFLLQQPRLLYGYLFVDANWKINNADSKDKTQSVSPPSPKSNLLPAQVKTYTESMKKLMEEEKPFLLPDFQISHLAQKLNIPVHHCSYVINNIIGKNFRDWINAHRIHHFITDYSVLGDKMTIEAIAYKAGFKSLATFYNAFKKETGLMPKTYFGARE